jgi:ribosomal protein S18 acetylase RimI-like enzyme
VTTDAAPAIPAAARWRVSSGRPDPATVGRLLLSLPEWFGIESAVAGYVRAARELPTYLAWPQAAPASAPAGVLLAARHFPCAAEIILIAVDRAFHRQGAGRALVSALEADLSADGADLLQVKTLGPSRPDPGYARTRQFYAGLGFRPLEETDELWPDYPCLVMVKVIRDCGPDARR